MKRHKCYTDNFSALLLISEIKNKGTLPGKHPTSIRRRSDVRSTSGANRVGARLTIYSQYNLKKVDMCSIPVNDSVALITNIAT